MTKYLINNFDKKTWIFIIAVMGALAMPVSSALNDSIDLISYLIMYFLFVMLFYTSFSYIHKPNKKRSGKIWSGFVATFSGLLYFIFFAGLFLNPFRFGVYLFFLLLHFGSGCLLYYVARYRKEDKNFAFRVGFLLLPIFGLIYYFIEVYLNKKK